MNARTRKFRPTKRPGALFALMMTATLGLTLAACSPTAPGGGAPGDAQSSLVGETVDLGVGGEAVTVGLTYVPNVQFAPVYVAGSDEIFRAAGIGASIRHHGPDEGLFTALMSGDEDVTVASGDEVLQARAAGMDLLAIGAYYHAYPVVLAAKQSSGIETIKDLQGKKVGIPGEFGSNWFGLLAALDAAGMTTSDIDVVPVGFTQSASLASDQVDAIVAFVNSEVVQVQELGIPVNVIPLMDGTPPLVGATIVTTTAWAEAHPELASGVVGAITAGTDRVLKNPQHALEVTAKWDPALADPQTRAGALAVLEATLPLWRDASGSASGVQDLDTWEQMGVFLASILDDPVPDEDVDDAVTNRFAQ